MLGAAALVSLTTSVWPLAMLPAELVKAPPAMEYSPPVMLMGVAVLIPEIVTAVELMVAFRAAPVTALKLKASGVVSAGATLVELVELLELEELPSEAILELLETIDIELKGVELRLDERVVFPPPPPPPQALMIKVNKMVNKVQIRREFVISVNLLKVYRLF